MTDPALKLDKLTKAFDKVTVLKGINATVMPGEVIGLLGLNGAGKTTLLETALGFSLPQTGTAHVFGKLSTDMDGSTKARIGFVPQRDELLEGMKAGDYLKLIAEFYPGWDPALVDRLALEWNVALNTRISKLSVGQRQKLSIISALAHHPDLIVLDEPVASLDPVARRQFLKEIVDIASTGSCAILFSTHIVGDLERIASRVWLMRDGNISIDAGMDELKETFVRISLAPGHPLPADLDGATVLHTRMEKDYQVLLLSHWSESAELMLKQTGVGPVDVAHLSLEDLFLELHA